MFYPANPKKGFTLVELLIVIAILAILAVIGTVVFSNVSKGARDAKRKEDVNAIAKAYETNYSNGYITLTSANFASGSIPTPPEGNIGGNNGTYFNVIATDGSGFKVCAALEKNPSRVCNTSSSNCFCIGSAQGTINVSSPLTGDHSDLGLGGSLAADSFTRTVPGGWGSADVGGAYTINGTASDYNVNGNEGTMLIQGTGSTYFRVARTDSVSQQDIDAKVKIKINAMPTVVNGALLCYIVARRQTGGSEYRGRIGFYNSSGAPVIKLMPAYAPSATGGDLFDIGGETNQGSYTPGIYMWLRYKLTGVNPTTINIKVWADGAAEPGTWNVTASDPPTIPPAYGPQLAGSVGLSCKSNSALTSGYPYTISFDDFSVN